MDFQDEAKKDSIHEELLLHNLVSNEKPGDSDSEDYRTYPLAE